MGCVHPSAKVYVLESTTATTTTQPVSHQVRLLMPNAREPDLLPLSSSRSSARAEANNAIISARVPMLALDRVPTPGSATSSGGKPLSTRRSPRDATPRSYRSPRDSGQLSHRSPREHSQSFHHEIRMVTARSSGKYPWLVKHLNTPPTSLDISTLTVQRVIGAGLMGLIGHAKLKGASTNLYVAVKGISKRNIIRHDDLRHVEREKHALLTLNHSKGRGGPFILRMFGTSQDTTHVYFITEFVPGGDLFRRLQEKKKFSSDVAKFYACEIFLALEFIAAHGFVYRDLKPENVLLDEEGHCKLADFGFTTQVGSDGKMYTFCGTPAYLSPEQLDRKVKKGYTKACDWWSFGVLVYEMLIGHTPFAREQKETAYSIYLRILDGKISLPFSLERSAKQLIRGCLNPDITKRMCSPKDIKRTAWLTTDWDAVAKKRVTPPFVPHFYGETDLHYFDDFEDFESFEDALQKQTDSASVDTEIDQTLFNGF